MNFQAVAAPQQGTLSHKIWFPSGTHSVRAAVFPLELFHYIVVLTYH